MTVNDEPLRSAIITHIAASLKPEDVPPGAYLVGDVEVRLVTGSSATLNRGRGNAIDKLGLSEDDPRYAEYIGFDLGEPPILQLDPMAYNLFLERQLPGMTVGDLTMLATECIRDAAKGLMTSPPAWFLAALEIVRKETPPGDPSKRKTPARRTDANLTTIKLRRLTKKELAAPKAVKQSAKKRVSA